MLISLAHSVLLYTVIFSSCVPVQNAETSIMSQDNFNNCTAFIFNPLRKPKGSAYLCLYKESCSIPPTVLFLHSVAADPCHFCSMKHNNTNLEQRNVMQACKNTDLCTEEGFSKGIR